ncbi:hypothetical protein L3i20_v227010 [Paenibacillus sp. L3-i20]|nr:hypothetical protein L3i20_v227010 [Paenibacillus sp. L3-i20]
MDELLTQIKHYKGYSAGINNIYRLLQSQAHKGKIKRNESGTVPDSFLENILIK